MLLCFMFIANYHFLKLYLLSEVETKNIMNFILKYQIIGILLRDECVFNSFKFTLHPNNSMKIRESIKEQFV